MKQRARMFLSAAVAALMALSATAFAACDSGNDNPTGDNPTGNNPVGGNDNNNDNNNNNNDNNNNDNNDNNDNTGDDKNNDTQVEVFEEDEVLPINIKDEYALDKVTTAGFDIGTVTENKGAFTLPQLVGDNMLLQANVTTKVWGKTTESGKIAAQILKKDGTAEATYYGEVQDGSFLVYLGGHDYGTDYTVRLVAESGRCVSIKNVAFGELWIGGGQSNMGWQMNQCYKGKTTRLLYSSEIEKSENSDIRLFHVYQDQSATPVDEVASSTGWKEANSDSVATFSAAAYFFAKELNAQYEVPVGVIMSCMGGTAIHTWLPESVLSDAVGTTDTANNNYSDSSYFNGMIYPLRNTVVRGVLWYQGEGDHNQYDVNYGLLMKGWRETFGRDNMWFTTVTLPRYPDENSYFLCREQQMAASVKDKYATYSVNIDCGLLPKDVASGDEINPQGIHPYDKKPIGERAAHVTMRDLYGAKGTWSGPTFKSATVKDGRVVITFSNVGKGLVLRGKFGFEIADKSKPDSYKSANVRLISKNQIEVYASGVTDPVKVIYGRVNDDLDEIESYADCVCLYNTKDDDDYAYPAEQFVWTKE